MRRPAGGRARTLAAARTAGSWGEHRAAARTKGNAGVWASSERPHPELFRGISRPWLARPNRASRRAGLHTGLLVSFFDEVEEPGLSRPARERTRRARGARRPPAAQRKFLVRRVV